MLIGHKVKGVLTEKQRKSLDIVNTILRAFYNDRHEEEERTWKQLLAKTKLSKSTLQKWLAELERQGIIKREAEIQNNRAISIYKCVNGFFEMQGKQETSVKEICRVYFSEKGIVDYQWGYLKKGKGGSRYFVPEKHLETGA